MDTALDKERTLVGGEEPSRILVRVRYQVDCGMPHSGNAVLRYYGRISGCTREGSSVNDRNHSHDRENPSGHAAVPVFVNLFDSPLFTDKPQVYTARTVKRQPSSLFYLSLNPF